MAGFQPLPFWLLAVLQWSGDGRRQVLVFPHLYPQAASSQYNGIVFSQFLVSVRQNQAKEKSKNLSVLK